MNIKVTKVFGNAKIELEIPASNYKDALFKASNLTVKDICGKCESTDISLEGNLDKENNQYIKRKCNKCTATSNLGTYKAGGYFWKAWEVYVRSEGGEQADSNTPDF